MGVFRARYIACLEMDFGDAHIIARDEAIKDFGKEAALMRRDPPHNAKIHRDNIACGVNEEISLMHVGMKKAVPHRMYEEGLDDEAAKPGHVMACRNECIAVRSGNAVDPFHRYDAPRCPLPVDA